MICHFRSNICAFCLLTYRWSQNRLESTFGFVPNSVILYFQLLTSVVRCFLNRWGYFKLHDCDFFEWVFWENFSSSEFQASSKFLYCFGRFDTFAVMGSMAIDWQKFEGAANFQVIYWSSVELNPNLSTSYQDPVERPSSHLFFYLQETWPEWLGGLFTWAFHRQQSI